MRQVPQAKPPICYGIVGKGRVAQHITYYFSQLNIPYFQWYRSYPRPPHKALKDCDVILLLISDGSIELFLQENPLLLAKKCVHFSGSLVSDLAEGVHPLMSFSQDLYPLDFYSRIPFILEEGGTPFHELFPALKNPAHQIDRNLKPLYHSLCVLSGNFTTLLWQKFFGDLKSRFNLPTEALLPYLEQTMKNLQNNPEGALTGPLQRKDLNTIISNYDALTGDPFQSIYQGFVQAMLPDFNKLLEDKTPS